MPHYVSEYVHEQVVHTSVENPSWENIYLITLKITYFPMNSKTLTANKKKQLPANRISPHSISIIRSDML